MDFVGLPDEVYSRLLSYITVDDALALSLVDKGTHPVIARQTNPDYHWMGRIGDLIGVEPDTLVLPPGISAKDQYIVTSCIHPEENATRNDLAICSAMAGAVVYLEYLLRQDIDLPLTYNDLLLHATGENEYIHAQGCSVVLPPDRWDAKVINKATRLGQTAVVELLLRDPRTDPTAEKHASIRNLCAMGNSRSLKLLLEDPRMTVPAEVILYDRLSMIEIAAQAGNVGAIKLLLSRPDWRSLLLPRIHMAIKIAVEEGKPLTVKALLQYYNMSERETYWIVINSLYKDKSRKALDVLRSDPVYSKYMNNVYQYG